MTEEKVMILLVEKDILSDKHFDLRIGTLLKIRQAGPTNLRVLRKFKNLLVLTDICANIINSEINTKKDPQSFPCALNFRF